ncbi:UPF0496 protein 1 [Canna indica]|uniref:UPF0496 protein 1 n=1 Tax=Canna indica TaxID=4628 RepID=A0AAQ3JLU7_9LILI|nr:UPF0496 protein 1 [Canna indica]
MGGSMSRRPGAQPVLQMDAIVGDATGAAAASSANGGGQGNLMAQLSSYEAACRLDPELQTFDATLQQRTSRAISTLALGVEVRSLSFDSLREVTGCLLEMNQEVARVILECKKDVWKNADLFELVEDYFDNSLQTLDFCSALENCLRKARDSQLIIHVALQRFAADDEQEVDEGGNNKYLRTFEELQHFKATGSPFTEEFFQLFQTVYGQQLVMLEKLQLKKRKLDKKLKAFKTWRKVSSIIFAATFAAVIICSVVAAAIAAPPVAASLAAAAAIPIPMGKWIDSLLKGYQEALRGQKEIVSSMYAGTYVSVKDLDVIQLLVDRLESQIKSLLDNADFAFRDEEAVRFVMEEIRKKLEVFMKSVEVLGEQADRCSRDIRRARTVILQKIIRQPK